MMTRKRTRDAGGERDARTEAATVEAAAGQGKPWTCGVTVHQLDTMDRLLATIAAHGDVLAAVGSAGLAPGTLPVIGQAIHEHAQALRTVLDQVCEQQHVRSPRRDVEDLRATYTSMSLPISGEPTLAHTRH